MWAGVTARGVVELPATEAAPEREGVTEGGEAAAARGLSDLDDLQGYGGTSEALIGSREATSGERSRAPQRKRPKPKRKQPKKKPPKKKARKAAPQRKASPRDLLPGAVI